MNNLLVAEELEKSYGIRKLFDKISFGIHEGDHIGLIGINGTGKTTLLKMIAGLEEPDNGNIITGNQLRIAYLPQTPVFDNKRSILDNVLIEQKPAEESYRNISGEASAMLLKLGIEDSSISPEYLSGGQKKRIALVKTLLSPSDLLILDEPTNHLDNEMTEWLEDVLQKYKGAYLMVTHDRYFLDEVTNKIWELDHGKLFSYQTNYSGYVEMKAKRDQDAISTEQKNRNLYRMELMWMLRGARARSTKQKAHIQRFEALKNRDDLIIDDSLQIDSAYSRLGKKTVELHGISKSYGEKTLFRDLDYIFLQNARIGIIGSNGCGKSTLLKVMTGQVSPDTGSVEYGITVKYGFFSQENEALDETKRVIDYIRDTAEFIDTKDGKISASQMCENFLFSGDMQYSLIGKLSGGEKRRLYLLHVLMSAPNVLILDEPTNDLDIKTLTILEQYLLQFSGIVIAVSHDRYFLDKIATGLLIFREGGIIEKQEGNYTDFRERELQKRDANTTEVQKAETVKSGKSRPRTEKKKFTYQEQKEYETIETVIAKLEDEINHIDTQMNEAVTDYTKLEQLSLQKTALETELNEKLERWIYLQELDESFHN